MSDGLVNGIGGTVMGDQESIWPEKRATPHDVIACYFRSWGWNLAHRTASEVVLELRKHGFHFCRVTEVAESPKSEGRPLLASAKRSEGK